MLQRDPVRITAVLLALAGLLACGPPSAKQEDPVDHDSTYAVRMARSLMNAGRTSEALAALDEAIAKEPDNAGLYNFRGQICLLSGRADQAVEAFNKALAADPYLTDAHNNLGLAYLELGQYNEAEQNLRQALTDAGYPTPEKVYLNLGLMYEKQGRDEEAIAEMRKAVGIDPRYYQAHYHLASILERVGKLAEAGKEYEVAEPAYRANGEYWYRRGMTYYLLGDRQKALDSLLRVRSIAPGSDSAVKADEILELLN